MIKLEVGKEYCCRNAYLIIRITKAHPTCYEYEIVSGEGNKPYIFEKDSSFHNMLVPVEPGVKPYREYSFTFRHVNTGFHVIVKCPFQDVPLAWGCLTQIVKNPTEFVLED